MTPLAASARCPLCGWVAETLRHWRWMHSGLALLVGTASVVYGGVPLLPMPDGPGAGVLWLYHVFQVGVPVVFAVGVADRAAAAGCHRVLAYGMAIVVVAVGGTWFGFHLVAPLDSGNPTWGFRSNLWKMLHAALPSGLGIAGYAYWRMEQRALERLRLDELNRARQRQMLRAARLLATQARVEPELLFDTLQHIRGLLDTSVTLADDLLADLIAMLRAILPAPGADVSTVEREFGLARAFARVRAARQRAGSAWSFSATPDAERASLAPMVLLPTLRGLAGNTAHGWQVQATRVVDRLRLEIAPVPPAGESAQAALHALDLAALRDRLIAVHGDEAAVRVASGADPGLLIELPYRHDKSTDR